MEIRSVVKNLGRRSYGAHTGKTEDDILDCALGTNVFGTSPRVMDFITNYDWSSVSQYPDNSYRCLKEGLCCFWKDYADLSVKNIKIANGSSFNLSYLNKMLIETGDKVVGCVPQFTEYRFEVEVLGGRYEPVSLKPEENFRFNFDRLVQAITPDCKIVYLNNPNNPTGESISLELIEAVVKEAARRGAAVILDEAYGDYLEERNSAVKLIGRYPNLIVTRTFSKCYGLAQVRVGYSVLSEQLGRYYDEVDLPFSTATFSAELAAVALLDHDFILNTRKRVRTEKLKIIAELKRRGFLISETSDTCPIFVAGSRGRDDKLSDYFLSKKIHVVSGIAFDNLTEKYVRISTPVSAQDFITRLSV
jgi:histidinol-phosphate aminotransferase